MLGKDIKKVLLVSHSTETDVRNLKLHTAISCISESVITLFAFHKNYKRDIIDKFFTFIKLPNDPCRLNYRLINEVSKSKPELVIIVKGVIIKPVTLRKLKIIHPEIKLVSWSNDDIFHPHHKRWYLIWGLKYYDLVVTQKSVNLEKGNLIDIVGKEKLLYQYKAYEKSMHFPEECNENGRFKFDVLFIGRYEKERLENLMYLAENNIKVHVFGWSGDNKMHHHPNLVLSNLHLYHQDLREAYSCSKICLNFLSKIVDDKHTSRSIEIPACKGFMLAERTQEHLELFEEGKEAAYFSNKEELLCKVKYYLENDDERTRIAEKGYLKCKENKYSFNNRVEEILSKLYFKI